ncbi:response regulator protein GraR [Clostridium tepidiprofundi DSM 19306]|uniref:Stage 0 sporulation protein A homolog n=1 Tax=Clostridium tepidiprofundi DSM 19306 TaxID=1121338 RepID=A0A151B3Q9_9CLOT|nr:response regulator transcription factor [Clostridium tepidiprofundi]KYH34559.1 response regulator protein GraR [Clostridium tepidiprofundi DSM 19306]
MFNIMIVEDCENIRNELSLLLKRKGYNVIAPVQFDNIPLTVKETNPHLILLDINLPNYDGFNVCTKIRSFSNVPIIFVTSRNTDIDELMSITLGGDDFITKPYNTSILIARISAILRRAYPNLKSCDIIEHRGVKLNILTNKIEYNSKEVELTKNEFKIFYYLLTNKSRIVSRVDIIEYLWDSKLFVNDNTLTVNIARIRDKLKMLGVNDFIKTKRGQGYSV